MADAADDAAALTSFDEFFERALSLDVLTEAEVDALTDAVASGALSEEGAIERHRAALDAALHPRRIGVVLDLHYVQIATRSFGQLTAFSPLALYFWGKAFPKFIRIFREFSGLVRPLRVLSRSACLRRGGKGATAPAGATAARERRGAAGADRGSCEGDPSRCHLLGNFP